MHKSSHSPAGSVSLDKNKVQRREAPVSPGSCYHLCLCRGDGEVQKRCVSAITPLYACVSVCLCVYLYLCVYVFHKTFAIWLSKNYRNYEKNRVAEGHLKT